jgi:hypothetical protein
MQKFRITHHCAAGYGWGFRCDAIRMSGGLENLPHYTFEDSRREAEAVIWFYLEGETEEHGVPLPEPHDVHIEHVLESRAAAAA